MKLLTLADIHGSWRVPYMVEELQSSYDFDAILIAGDITNFGEGGFLEEFLNALPKPTLAVPGNCDPPWVIETLRKSKAVSLHFSIHKMGDFKFAGVGGTNGKGFTMGITFREDEARDFLTGCEDKCVFLTHQPPLGILDSVGSRHIGSRGIAEAIGIAKPILVVSGHVHEARGYEFVENTLVLNPGPAKDGYAAIVNLLTLEVEMLKH